MIFIIFWLFFSLILFLLVGIIFSSIKLNIKKFNIHNSKISFEIKVELWIYNLIKIISINVDEKGANIFKRKIPFFEKFRDSLILRIRQKNMKFNLNLSQLDLNLEKLNFYCVIGTENALLTVYLVTLISSIVSFFIKKFTKHYKNEKYDFTVLPIYNQRNIINLEFKGIFSSKMIHILYVIIKNKKGGSKKYERTSNRRAYENSYE